MTEEKCVSTGSGSPIAYGVLESEFKEGMAVKEALSIVVRSINTAMKRDAASGDSFDVAFVTKDGYSELTEKKKTDELYKTASNHSNKLAILKNNYMSIKGRRRRTSLPGYSLQSLYSGLVNP